MCKIELEKLFLETKKLLSEVATPQDIKECTNNIMQKLNNINIKTKEESVLKDKILIYITFANKYMKNNLENNQVYTWLR